MNVVAPQASSPVSPAPKRTPKEPTGDFAASLRDEQDAAHGDAVDREAPRGGADEAAHHPRAPQDETAAAAPSRSADGEHRVDEEGALPPPLDVAPEGTTQDDPVAAAFEAPPGAIDAAPPAAPNGELAETATGELAETATGELEAARAEAPPLPVPPAASRDAGASSTPEVTHRTAAEATASQRGVPGRPALPLEARTEARADVAPPATPPDGAPLADDARAETSPLGADRAAHRDEGDWHGLADRLHEDLRRAPPAAVQGPQARNARAAATLAFLTPMVATADIAAPTAMAAPPPVAEAPQEPHPTPKAEEAPGPVRSATPANGEATGDDAMGQNPSGEREGASPDVSQEAAPAEAGPRPTRSMDGPRLAATPTTEPASPVKPTAPSAPAVAPEVAWDVDRQEAAATAVNRMTLRRGADAEIDVPELGRIRVSAQTVGREVDVELTSREAAAVAVLHSTRSQMVSELRTGEIDLRHLEVRHDERAPQDDRRGRDASTHDREASRRGRDGTGPATSNANRGSTGEPPPQTVAGNVRVVL